ncbi:hypothetical protein THS27_15415 [Thalassospira sp. MCCC 1A01428]|nr:hypothetical protein THS27_15415 [Thalassospira sp. MCCC 1A01428]
MPAPIQNGEKTGKRAQISFLYQGVYLPVSVLAIFAVAHIASPHFARMIAIKTGCPQTPCFRSGPTASSMPQSGDIACLPGPK